jgi:hypothetical protein
MKHRDLRVISLIDTPLWDRAGWLATAVVWANTPEAPPLFVLGFSDRDAGREIFEGLRSNLGDLDANDSLRVCIITGIDRKNPSSYKVVIGANPKMINELNSHGTAKQIVTISRINRMDPANSRNLEVFRDLLKSTGRYIIAPACYNGELKLEDISFELGIGKYHLHIRPAWQIAENDPDICAFEQDDDPIIPPEVSDPPVLRALERLSALAKR